MPPSGSTRRKRQRGEIETLPSGSLRVRVYAGIDLISGEKHHLIEVIPAGKDAAKLAEKARTRMQAEVDERRNPRTKATIAQLMERYLDVLSIEYTTRAGYERLVRLHIGPLLGHLAVGRIDGETLDSFYRELRQCRTHCAGRPVEDHHSPGEHTCDKRCGPHRCQPLSTSSSVRRTTCSTARSPGLCAGGGSGATQSGRPSRQRFRRPTLSRPRQRKPRGSSGRRSPMWTTGAAQ
jgi:integrase